ncbi:unnamed protein product, partial [Allacma fusca]
LVVVTTEFEADNVWWVESKRLTMATLARLLPLPTNNVRDREDERALAKPS